MADTFSTALGLRYQQTGGNDNTWGELLNTDVFALLERGITGRALHAVTGGTLDLSATPVVDDVQVFTGILTADETVTLPDAVRKLTIFNACTGSFALLLKASGSSTLTRIPPNRFVQVFCNAAGGVLRFDGSEVGGIRAHGGTTAPNGYLECDGSAISRTNYPELFGIIGTTWGVGNGATTFNIPDFKTDGRFLRSRTGSVAVGTLQAADIAAHGHSGSTATFTGTQFSVTPAGSVSVSTPAGSVSVTLSSSNGSGSTITLGGSSSAGTLNVGTQLGTTTLGATGGFTGSAASGSFSGTQFSVTPAGSVGVTIANSSGTETRPINASVMMVIKY